MDIESRDSHAHLRNEESRGVVLIIALPRYLIVIPKVATFHNTQGGIIIIIPKESDIATRPLISLVNGKLLVRRYNKVFSALV